MLNDMKQIFVNLTNQILYAFDGEVVFRQYHCVSGSNANPTTIGHHHIGRKRINHRSRQFNNAPMNYAMFFHRGEAIHESSRVDIMSLSRTILRRFGQEARDPYGSHGCVRLNSEAARELFDWTPIGTRVIVDLNPTLPGPYLDGAFWRNPDGITIPRPNRP